MRRAHRQTARRRPRPQGRLLGLGEDDALDRRHVAVVAAPGDGDVAVVGPLVVGRVDREPLARSAGQPSTADPGVGGVGADDPLLARRRLGGEVAADVAGGEAVACAGRPASGGRSPGRPRPARRRSRRPSRSRSWRSRRSSKSAWIRCIRSVTASPIGRPGVSDAAAYACASAVCVDQRRRQREVGGPPRARRRRVEQRPGPLPRLRPARPRRTPASRRRPRWSPSTTSSRCGSVTWKYVAVLP